MAYLEPAEYLAFGLGADTADAWVAAASAMVDGFCRRASLLLVSYTERLRVSRCGTVQLTYGPMSSVSALRGQYARPRAGMGGDLLPYALAFGLPGQWVDLDPTTLGAPTSDGELALPVNMMGLPFAEVEITYAAGLPDVPTPVKIAVAQIVKNAQATPGLNVRSSRLDALQTEYFSDSLLDVQVKAMLRPYAAERVGL